MTHRPPLESSVAPAREPLWPRVYIADTFVRDAVAHSLEGASEWLQAPRCQMLLTEFVDGRGRSLTERLAELNLSTAEYLRVVIFRDAEVAPQCQAPGVLAFTLTNSRIVYVCGRVFVRAAKRDAAEGRATVIHEVLHSLGLGENPPRPQDITFRIKQLCS